MKLNIDEIKKPMTAYACEIGEDGYYYIWELYDSKEEAEKELLYRWYHLPEEEKSNTKYAHTSIYDCDGNGYLTLNDSGIILK